MSVPAIVHTENRKVTTEEAKRWCGENGIVNILETSSKTGQNVELAFTKAAETIKARHTYSPQYVLPTQLF